MQLLLLCKMSCKQTARSGTNGHKRIHRQTCIKLFSKGSDRVDCCSGHMHKQLCHLIRRCLRGLIHGNASLDQALQGGPDWPGAAWAAPKSCRAQTGSQGICCRPNTLPVSSRHDLMCIDQLIYLLPVSSRPGLICIDQLTCIAWIVHESTGIGPAGKLLM